MARPVLLIAGGRDPEGLDDARIGVVGDHPAGGNSPDRVVAKVGEPQGVITDGSDGAPSGC